MQPEINSEMLLIARLATEWLFCGRSELAPDTDFTEFFGPPLKNLKRTRDTEADSDVRFVRLMTSTYNGTGLLTRVSSGEVPDTDLVLVLKAIERILNRARDALAKDSSNLGALLQYLRHLITYIELILPDKRDLYHEPLNFLVSVLTQAQNGSLHPLLVQKVHSRPTDSMLKKRFKVTCVVAGDLYFEADKQAGLQRRSLTRAQADDMICRQARVQKTAKKLGLNPTPTAMKGWRREIRAAPEGSTFNLIEDIARDCAQRMLDERDVNAAVELILRIDTNEQRII